jgi:hypothetical protein
MAVTVTSTGEKIVYNKMIMLYNTDDEYSLGSMTARD